MGKTKFILRFVVFAVILQLMHLPQSRAQLPSNDSAWKIDTNLSDEFNSGTINTIKWDTVYCFWDTINDVCRNVANGAEWDYNRNLIMTDTTLKIKADTLISNRYQAWGTFPDYEYGTHGSGITYAYQGGVIQSKDPDYKFGYVEVYAKFPSKKWPLWPALWLYWSACPNYYNEIDFAENGAEQSFAGNRIGNNYQPKNTSCDGLEQGGIINDVTLNVDSLSGGFHKFAVQWDPHRIFFYFDDVPTTTVYSSDGTGVPQHAMKLIMNFCISPWGAFLPSNWNGAIVTPHGNNTPTKWPQYLEIDYARYYKLETDCNTNDTICAPGDYDRKVKKTIVTDDTCSPNFNPSDDDGSYTLRATDYVIINEGTTINPTGTGYFAIDVMDCPQ